MSNAKCRIGRRWSSALPAAGPSVPPSGFFVIRHWSFVIDSVSLIRLQNITRRYQMGAEIIHALRDVSLEIQRGDYVVIMGPSGSGKSALMNVVGCLDTPTSGRYDLNGTNVSEMDDNQLAEVRN